MPPGWAREGLRLRGSAAQGSQADPIERLAITMTDITWRFAAEPVTGSRGSLRRARIELLAASAVVLFQELALIRALPGQVRVLGYFPNLILISAFLGLGAGALRAGRRSLLWLWPPSLLLLTALTAFLGRIAFTANSVSEHLWLLYFDLPAGTPVIEGVRLPIVAVFFATAVTFVPLGQVVADRLTIFQRESASLWGYALDLTGSLAGVLLFSALSFLGTTPTTWLAVTLAVAAILYLPRPRLRVLYTLAGVGTLLTVHLSERAERYSPYYAISLSRDLGANGVRLLANGSLHQVAWPMARDSVALSERHARHRAGLHTPLDLMGGRPRRALVLGAGTGNDVAALLDRGVEHIDAVEIDPVIVELGRELHPDRPYDSHKVTVHETDARSFLNDSEEEYDLIVFGTLDSMTRLSALSAVRLDNFVYTRESIQAARDRLSDGGGLALSFWVDELHIHAYLATLLWEAFGEAPAVVSHDFAMLNTIYLAGPAFAHLEPTWRLEQRLPAEAAPTDDWPYLYLPSRGVAPVYVSLILILLGLAVVMVLAASTELREGLARRRGIDGEMFLYGFAFLLMETRYVTEMNLLWGATWMTSAVVFGAILAVILVGTIAMQLRPISFWPAFAGLIFAILITYLVPVDWLVSQSRPLRLVLSVGYAGLPVLFASLCFALRFRERTSPDLAFGWNLLGAVVGGFTELLSMAVGLKALLLVAGGAYLLSAFAAREVRGWRRSRAIEQPA